MLLVFHIIFKLREGIGSLPLTVQLALAYLLPWLLLSSSLLLSHCSPSHSPPLSLLYPTSHGRMKALFSLGQLQVSSHREVFPSHCCFCLLLGPSWLFLSLFSLFIFFRALGSKYNTPFPRHCKHIWNIRQHVCPVSHVGKNSRWYLIGCTSPSLDVTNSVVTQS